ncbi:uncharacterized protein LOC131696413 [Topomyia yanbarensis]|uniref:uncharacterized protein LOC131696413 n=1 Tax=Topomyia yanbarensis TaxID=2498891 RepID=UPI00273AD4A2|nr:uncharacterized protein LOC131696413 [Topomyia yanbarensis]
MTAPTIAQALISGWIYRYGVPTHITSDQGRQFQSTLFTELSNGIIERWYRTLKAAILYHNPERWTEHLPMILLGLRTIYKEDIKSSPAEMVYGIPLEFFVENTHHIADSEFANNLREAMRELRPFDTAWHGKCNVFVNPDLQTCKHVFIRNDSIRPSLSPPCDGPYEVLGRTNKHYTININGRRTANISIDRLKPAYIVEDHQPQPTIDRGATTTTVTRSGPRVQIPLRYR